MVGIGVLLLALSSSGLLRPVEDASFVVLSPIEDGLRSIARPIADAAANLGNVRELTLENEALRSDNERLNAEIARLREESVQQEQLGRLLEVTSSLADQQFLAAKIYAGSPINLRQLVAIDRGTSDGIKVGMPVLTEGNTLVGTVTSVTATHSWVTLVTDVNSAVSSLILESRAKGVVSGGYDRRLTMEFVTQDSLLSEGDTVVSSGLGGTYPAGLVIGQISSISGSPQEIFRRVAVEPFASLSRLETVLVMISFTPTRVSAP